MSGTLIEKTSHDLALAVAANVTTCGLSLEAQEYYLQNKHLIPDAIIRGFTLPVPEIQTVANVVSAPALPVVFKTTDTDLDSWLDKCQEFTKKYLGVEVKIREMFNIPEELPWGSAIPVFDPGGLTNREAVEKALKAQKLVVWEEVDVMKYGGSEANKKPTLHLIQNSIQPDEDTLNQRPDQLVATGTSWLNQRGYMFAFGLHHFVTGQYLDPQTWTWFPNDRLSSAKVASGRWHPDDREVRFCWRHSGYRCPGMGARLAMPVSIRP